MWRVYFLIWAVQAAGCASRPRVQSVDGEVNYGYVFAGMESPRPVVVNSRVERERTSVEGIVPVESEYNGLWEFEVLASRAWVDSLLRGRQHRRSGYGFLCGGFEWRTQFYDFEDQRISVDLAMDEPDSRGVF
jgi:hypothetical protein